MPPLLRRLAAASAIATLALGAACREPTAPEYGPDAESRAAAETFSRVADSLAHSGGDATVVSGYYGLARWVSASGRTSPLTVTVDGTAEEYLATAQQLDLLTPALPCAYPGCTSLPPVRGLVAWRRGDPRRVLQLTEGRLTFFDGKGGFFGGPAATSSFELLSSSDEPCFVYPPVSALASSSSSSTTDLAPWSRCTRAEFSVSAHGTVQPAAASALAGNTATGSHAIDVAPQTVHGGRFQLPLWACLECAMTGYPAFLLPPLTVTPRQQLGATLTATLGDVVTLTFTVTNGGATPATAQFSTGQRYDFVVTDPASMAVIWRWSADKVFTQSLGSLTLAPGEKITFTERWTPTVHGNVIAQAALMSSSHQAYALRYFTLP